MNRVETSPEGAHLDRKRKDLLEKAPRLFIQPAEAKQLLVDTMQQFGAGVLSFQDTADILHTLKIEYPDKVIETYYSHFMGYWLSAEPRSYAKHKAEAAKHTVDQASADTRQGVLQLDSAKYLGMQIHSEQKGEGAQQLREFSKQADRTVIAGEGTLQTADEARKRAADIAMLSKLNTVYGKKYEQCLHGCTVGDIEVETGNGAITFMIRTDGVRRYPDSLQAGLALLIDLEKGKATPNDVLKLPRANIGGR